MELSFPQTMTSWTNDPIPTKGEMLDDKLHDCESILIALSKKTNRTLRELLERTVWLEEEGN